MRGRGRRSPSRFENHRSFTVPGSVSRFAPSVRNDGSSFHGKPPQTMEEKEGTNNSKPPTAVVCSPSERGGLTLPACIGDKDRLPHVERPQYDRTMLSAAVDCYSKDFESSSVPNMGSMGRPSCTKKSQYGQTSMERNVDNVSTQPAHFPSSANLEDEPIFCFSEDRDSLNGKSQHRKISPKKSVGNSYSGQPEFSLNILPFDICHVKSRNVVSLKPSLLEKNREKRKELERFKRSHQLLRPGMVLLKSYISPNDQVKIMKICRQLGLGPGGFYQPGYRDGAKLHIQMMCLGRNWDPETRLYGNQRATDGAEPPSIPDELKDLVKRAMQDTHAFLKQEIKTSNVEEALPAMSPDICIVNFYSTSGRLGLHQDRDESTESLDKGFPVVSFSIGDSADFLYGDNRDTDKAEKVILQSGDVLIFGGKSRLIYHGVPTIIPNSAPKYLVDDANLRPGRLNLTFRKY